MLINVESAKSVEEVRQKLEETAKAKGFGVMSTHEVTKILESKGQPINYSCVIVEICQPRAASQVLSRNPYISTAMPCRVAIFEQGGKTILSTIAPTEMLNMFNEQELEGIAQEVEKLVREIMEESAK
ncbi:uncharacterized protein (DUF302 family) [Hydrogenivirga caldilitoris]|uniref:Uncharacterized protein (DUF302 family) n=1 Tax=Hydrogenivirga caldilitoris TaxID=246264 RepID=A0A497XSD6_9AQUI|nr:DUF302 domain-containing protein [Hydrogenivirga caldilitoris]RLJ71161.1 uncharacterized protein (DUF302 family) [Hydrogenivirga caldilitoris]